MTVGGQVPLPHHLGVCVICGGRALYNAYFDLWVHDHNGSHDHFDHAATPLRGRR